MRLCWIIFNTFSRQIVWQRQVQAGTCSSWEGICLCNVSPSGGGDESEIKSLTLLPPTPNRVNILIKRTSKLIIALHCFFFSSVLVILIDVNQDGSVGQFELENSLLSCLCNVSYLLSRPGQLSVQYYTFPCSQSHLGVIQLNTDTGTRFSPLWNVICTGWACAGGWGHVAPGRGWTMSTDGEICCQHRPLPTHPTPSLTFLVKCQLIYRIERIDMSVFIRMNHSIL